VGAPDRSIPSYYSRGLGPNWDRFRHPEACHLRSRAPFRSSSQYVGRPHPPDREYTQNRRRPNWGRSNGGLWAKSLFGHHRDRGTTTGLVHDAVVQIRELARISGPSIAVGGSSPVPGHKSRAAELRSPERPTGGRAACILFNVNARFVASIFLLLAPLMVQSDGPYKWSDPSGEIWYGDQRPSDRPSEEVWVDPGPSPADFRRAKERAIWVQRSLERRIQREQEQAQRQIDYQRTREARRQRCLAMRREATWLTQIWAPVLPVPSPDGTMSAITNAERLARIESLYQKIRTECDHPSVWQQEWDTFFPPHSASRQVVPTSPRTRAGPSTSPTRH
jgi:hypothetical protein